MLWQTADTRWRKVFAALVEAARSQQKERSPRN